LCVGGVSEQGLPVLFFQIDGQIAAHEAWSPCPATAGCASVRVNDCMSGRGKTITFNGGKHNTGLMARIIID
jgi:hypothetical protein